MKFLAKEDFQGFSKVEVESQAWVTEILVNADMPIRERRELAGFLLNSRSEHGELGHSDADIQRIAVALGEEK